MNKEERVCELIDELRELTKELSPTKDEAIPRSQRLDHGKIDKMYDIDIFFSRKPGMRRSIQFVASGTDKPEALKLSCLTAICSLCDTITRYKTLNTSKIDIAKAMISWIEINGMEIEKLK